MHSGERRVARLFAGLVMAMMADAVGPAVAQDVPGIEICTRESRLDRRTGCLQSNVEFLQQVIGKNAVDAQQKLNAANRDIAALRELLAAANHDIAALKESVANAQAQIDQIRKPDPSSKSDMGGTLQVVPKSPANTSPAPVPPGK